MIAEGRLQADSGQCFHAELGNREERAFHRLCLRTSLHRILIMIKRASSASVSRTKYLKVCWTKIRSKAKCKVNKMPKDWESGGISGTSAAATSERRGIRDLSSSHISVEGVPGPQLHHIIPKSSPTGLWGWLLGGSLCVTSLPHTRQELSRLGSRRGGDPIFFRVFGFWSE